MTDEICLFTDGGARPTNPGPAAIGGLILDPAGKQLHSWAERIGFHSNNEAEYLALLHGLKICLEYTDIRVNAFTDSLLVVHQMSGHWGFKKRELRLLASEVKLASERFQEVILRHVPREHPSLKKADRLVNRAFGR
jgi:ribonuclease HI